MITYIPNYYRKFRCIADKCRHNCCIGWEIDIDPETLDLYGILEGDTAKRLMSSMSYEGTPHFELLKGDRCPMLNENGLCDLICAFGEEALCNICRDHPRFRNFYSNSVEMGLGLCCEAAADLILYSDEPFELVQSEGSADAHFNCEEQYVLDKRHRFISIMKDRTKSIEERHRLLLEEAGDCELSKSLHKWCGFLLGLERLDDEWTKLLCEVQNSQQKEFFLLTEKSFQIALEQLTIYFLYRHMPSAIADGHIASKVRYAVISTQFIYTASRILKDKDKSKDFKDLLLNVSRMYCAEIEYSDENLEKIFDELY